MKTIERYLRQSREGLYGLVLVIPLFVIYEASMYLAEYKFRNGADALVTNVLDLVPVLSTLAVKLSFFLLLALTLYVSSGRRRINSTFIPFLLLESMIYSLFLGTVASRLLRPFFDFPFLSVASELLPTSFITAVGAGLYEELLFRFILFGGLVWAGSKIMKKKAFAVIFAAVISSLLFSGYHYLGPYGYQFEAYSFTFRAVAGLILTLIYYFRGFAVAAYTHAFYDIWVLGFF